MNKFLRAGWDARKFVTILSNLIEFYCEAFLSSKLFSIVIFGRARLRRREKNSIKISRHGSISLVWLLVRDHSDKFHFCTAACLGRKLQHHACLNTFLTLHCKTSLPARSRKRKFFFWCCYKRWISKNVNFIKLIYIFHALKGSFVGQVTTLNHSLEVYC